MDAVAEIRKRRVSLGIPLGDLARAIGRSDATLSRIERGQIRPSYDLVQRIDSYLSAQEGIAAPHLTARDVLRANVVTVPADATVADAAQTMERGGFSQLPVSDGGRVTGSVSEAALLKALARPTGRRQRVRDVQEAAYPQVDIDCPAELLAGLLTHYPAVLVAQRGSLTGIVTKTDLIRGLRATPMRRPAGSTSG